MTWRVKGGDGGMDTNKRTSHDMDAVERNMQFLKQLCNSKAEEFQMMGYENVFGEDIWACVSERYAKSGYPRLHRIVNDILTLKVTQLMNWMTMSALKGDFKF